MPVRGGGTTLPVVVDRTAQHNPGAGVPEFVPRIHVHDSREGAGRAAGAGITAELQRRLADQPEVRIVFAAAPSQQVMLAYLAGSTGIDWGRVTAFHLDEYVGLPAGDPRQFGPWLRRRLFDRVPLRAAHLIATDAEPERAAAGYAALLGIAPIDIICLGIGVNGHLAFNDPPITDFDDPQAVKVVNLDLASRRQQVDDGCFSSLAEVPTVAITVTIPPILAAQRLYCVVTGPAKRMAVTRALRGSIDPACPASALRLHPRCEVYLDAEAGHDLRSAGS